MKAPLFQPRLTEEHVVKEIMARLTYAGVNVWRVKERVPDTSSSAFKKRFRGGASSPGIPDLCGYVGGASQKDGHGKVYLKGGLPWTTWQHPRIVLIEVKRPGGKRRVMQEQFIERARRDGAIAFFADSWEAVVGGFEANGVLFGWQKR